MRYGSIIQNLAPGTTDRVPALLTPGEGVLNVGATKLLGKKKLDQLNRRGLQMMAKGGTVKPLRLQFGGMVPERSEFRADRLGALAPLVQMAVPANLGGLAGPTLETAGQFPFGPGDPGTAISRILAMPGAAGNFASAFGVLGGWGPKEY